MPTETIEVAAPAARPALRLAPRYKVLLHNDESTPMDYVCRVLESFFGKDAVEARAIMMEAHEGELALVEILSYEQAEFRVERAISHARARRYPLAFGIEAAD